MEGTMARRQVLRSSTAPLIGLTFSLLVALLLSACGVEQQAATATADRTAASQTQPSLPDRVITMQASDDDLASLSAGNNTFSLDLFRAVRAKGKNLVCSPYSVWTALTMTMVGARGETLDEMRRSLHLSLPDDRLHPAANDLDRMLTAGDGFRSANSIWGQTGRDFKQPFVDVVGHYYGASLRLLDMEADYPGACGLINEWVSDRTNGRITDLMDPDDQPGTPLLMMLVNAVHFKADWQDPFWPGAGQTWPFSLLDGQEVRVPMMQNIGEYRFAKTEALQAVELPYEGDRFSMVILMPVKGGFERFAGDLDQPELEAVIAGLEAGRLDLRLPSFEISSVPPVKAGLQALGMSLPFDRMAADFTGIADPLPGWPTWYISDVVQKAFVQVDEQGTEAAAASGVTVAAGAESTTTLTPPVMTVDHPFLYLIRDTVSGTILFIGQVTDPSQSG
jgi:serpin B